jgi:ATP-dependent RNA helicase DeaD
VLAAGRANGIEVADIIAAITKAAGVDGEAVRNVKLLERFAFLEVPTAEADRIITAVDGTEVRGHPLRLAPAGRG